MLWDIVDVAGVVGQVVGELGSAHGRHQRNLPAAAAVEAGPEGEAIR